MQRFNAHRLTALFAGLFLAFSMVAVDHAEARRGGSFGSRGSRTFQQAPATRTAPTPAAPVQRTMTPDPGPSATTRQPGTSAAQRPGLNSGFLGGGLFRGLMLGGLFGMLMGYGFGGAAGMLGFLLQLLLIGGGIWLVLRLLRGGAAARPAYAGAGGAAPARPAARAPEQRLVAAPRMAAGTAAPAADLSLGQSDLDTFERRLTEVQEAFGREDHAALRRLATPEMVSYFSEELAENAKNGLRNEVSDVRLLQADIAESWREGADDYATAAMLYESRDVMRDRTTGAAAGEEAGPSETTELWTFRRQNGGDWKLSAIQEVA